MPTRFLFNEALWTELAARIPKAKRVRAAVAYLGSGGAPLLPLKKGDQLVVDMSLRACGAGATDPRVVRKLLREGVEVYSRASLHAKFFVFDDTVIVGSANISANARSALDEAAILTDNQAAFARASATFDRLCTEPVRKDYLQRCLEAYRPPRMDGRRTGPGTKRSKVTRAKLWIIGGLRYIDLSEREEEQVETIVKKADECLLDFERSEVGWLRYLGAERWFRNLQPGDWGIRCIREGKGFEVHAPARFLGIEKYLSLRGKDRHLLLFEMPSDSKPIRWTEFRAAISAPLRKVVGTRPRTKPITSDEDADALLSLWTARGRFRRKTQ